MKSARYLLLPFAAGPLLLGSCDRKSSAPEEYNGQGPTTPPNQPDRPNPGQGAGEGSGTRSDYKPTTGQGAREETR